MGHAKYSPSASHRWIQCPGSIELSQGIESTESLAALTGTKAHECLELFLKNGPGKQLSTSAFLKRNPIYTTQMVVDAEAAAGEIWKMTPKGAALFSETKSECHHLDPEMEGTADAVILDDSTGELSVIDFKYGKMPVEAKQNSQMLAYAIGIAAKHDYLFTDIHLVIIQPRAHHVEGTLRKWTTTVETLFDWEEVFARAIRLSKEEHPPFKSGSHCFFCPAKNFCEVYGENEKYISKRFIPELSEKEKHAQLMFDFAEAPSEIELE